MITAKVLPLAKLIGAGRFRPPAVQRSYQWSPETARLLFRDIETAFRRGWSHPDEAEDDALDDEGDADPDEREVLEPEETGRSGGETTATDDPYFIGSFVLFEADDGTFEIFDGLQRLTTLTILFALLRDLNHDEESAKMVLAEGKPRLRISTEASLWDLVQAPGATQRKKAVRKDTEKHVKAVRDELFRALDDLDPTTRRAFATFLRERVHGCSFHVGRPQVGRQVFVSTNLIGERLEETDLLKGQLLDLAPEDKQTAFADSWGRLKEHAGDDFKNFWRAIDVIERQSAQGSTWTTDLAHAVAQREEGVMSWLARVEARAVWWHQLGDIAGSGGKTPFEHDLWRLSRLPWTEWQPLALLLFDRYHALRSDSQRATILKITDRLVRRSFGLMLAGSSDGQRRVVFANAVRQWLSGDDPTTNKRALVLRPKQREKVQRTLTTQMRDIGVVRALFDWLESLPWRTYVPDLARRGTVEHVMPRRPEDDPEEGWEEYERDCYALGNLVVLPHDLNHELQNAKFEQKRPLLLERATRSWTLESVVAHAGPDWGAAEIAARTELLTERVWGELAVSRPRARPGLA